MGNDGHLALAGTALVLGLASIPLCLFLNLGVVIGGVAIYGVFTYDLYTVLTDPQSRAQLNTISKQMNGVSFDEMLKELGVQIDG